MTTYATPAPTTRTMLGRMARIETRLFLRDRAGPIWVMAFPVVLLAILGTLGGRERSADLGGLTLAATYLPIVVAFSLAMAALNVLPPTLAGYRERGVLRRISTTPAPAALVLAAQALIALAVGVLTAAVVLVVGRLAFDVALPRQPVGYLVAFVLAAAALLGIGLTIAALAPSGRAANAIGALTFFPLMFFAGLWVPRPLMPDVLRDVSDWTPLGAAVQAMQDAAAGRWPHPLQLLVLAGYGALFAAISVRTFRWE